MLKLGLNRWVMWALTAYWFASGNDFAIQGILAPHRGLRTIASLMKNVECLRAADGTIVNTSKHSNIKIDKLTTYVLGPSDLLPVN
jgi:hypothetical protein